MNFQDPILKRIIYHTLTIFNIPQKVPKTDIYVENIKILIFSQILIFPFHFWKIWELLLE